MIKPEHQLSISRQAELLEISRSTIYYRPRPISDADLMLMRRIDELHLNYPLAGSRMLRDMLRQQGLEVGRCHVRAPDAANGHGGALSEAQHLQTRARAEDLSLPAARPPGHAAAQQGCSGSAQRVLVALHRQPASASSAAPLKPATLDVDLKLTWMQGCRLGAADIDLGESSAAIQAGTLHLQAQGDAVWIGSCQ